MNAGSDKSILDSVAQYYTSKLVMHGATPRGVDWNNTESHMVRHRQFLRLLADSPDASVLDLGCGFGDFLPFLRTQGHRGNFIGYDVAAGMIDEALRQHGEGTDRRWHIGAKPEESADFSVASGVFNVKGDVSNEAWTPYVRETIDRLARVGRRGFGFNMLSLSNDPERRRSNLFYADPVEMLAYSLSRFGRSVALLQDYGLWEFTIIVRLL